MRGAVSWNVNYLYSRFPYLFDTWRQFRFYLGYRLLINNTQRRIFMSGKNNLRYDHPNGLNRIHVCVFIKKINKLFILKCDIYYAFTFKP